MKAKRKGAVPARAAKRCLSLEEIAGVSSYYLSEGRKQDSWEITHVDIEDGLLTAGIRMRSYYTSPSDKGGFHLSQISALEFLSQLMIILVHDWAGYKEKTREAWMIDSAISCKRVIRSAENIQVRMRVASIRKVRGSILIVTKARISDGAGLFEATLKGLLSS